MVVGHNGRRFLRARNCITFHWKEKKKSPLSVTSGERAYVRTKRGGKKHEVKNRNKREGNWRDGDLDQEAYRRRSIKNELWFSLCFAVVFMWGIGRFLDGM